MYSTERKQQLQDFAKAISIPVGLTDGAKWPVRAGTVIFPVRNALVREFLEQIHEANIIGDEEQWRKAFDGPTQLWRMSHHLINGLVDDQIDNHEIANAILTLLEGIAALSYNHYFEPMGNHLILPVSMLETALNVELLSNKTDSRLALLLSGLIWSYSETNYFVAHELSCEYHGAYLISEGRYAIIRDFKNLAPIELWPNRNYARIPQSIRVISIHDKSLSIGFDVYNNLYDDTGTMSSSLISSAVIADGHVLSVPEIADMISLFSEKVTVFAEQVNALSKSEIAKKYMEVFWYRKKSLADFMGISWKPSATLYQVLEQGLLKGPEKKAGSMPSSGPSLEQLALHYDYSQYDNLD